MYTGWYLSHKPYQTVPVSQIKNTFPSSEVKLLFIEWGVRSEEQDRGQSVTTSLCRETLQSLNLARDSDLLRTDYTLRPCCGDVGQSLSQTCLSFTWITKSLYIFYRTYMSSLRLGQYKAPVPNLALTSEGRCQITSATKNTITVFKLRMRNCLEKENTLNWVSLHWRQKQSEDIINTSTGCLHVCVMREIAAI